MNFIALDVETANSDYSSICQIGIVQFKDGKPSILFESLVNPLMSFNKRNSSIHGIKEPDILNQPSWAKLYPHIQSILANQIVVHHTHFDYTSINLVCEKNQLAKLTCRWLDTARIVRRTWPEVQKSGYGLKPMAEKLGIKFGHHHATEDARAAGEILVIALQHSGCSLDEWINRLSA